MNFKSIISNKWVLGVLFFAIYAALVSWKFSLVLMFSIGFHESGHLWAAKRKGLSTGGFYFIPFMGGTATITENYKTYAQQAYVAIMGPIWGLCLAALTMIIGIITHSSFCTIAASWMALFNLFNLIPVTFLDGGQTLKTIALTLSKKNGFLIINVVTIIAAGIFILYVPSLLVIMAAIFSIIQNNTEKKMILAGKNYRQPKDLTKKQIAFTIGSYFLTAILLVFVFFFSLACTHALTDHYTYWIK